MQLFTVCRTKNRDRRRITEYMHRRDTERAKSLITEIEEFDQEAERLSDTLELYVKDKRKRDFEIRLLKGDIEKSKKYPLGVPPGPSPEYLQEQRKREAEKARKDAEFQRKCEEEEEAEPLMMYMKEVKANLAIDRDYYRKQRQAEAAQDADRWRRANRMPETVTKQLAAAQERAKVAGRDFPKLSLKVIRDVMQGKL